MFACLVILVIGPQANKHDVVCIVLVLCLNCLEINAQYSHVSNLYHRIKDFDTNGITPPPPPSPFPVVIPAPLSVNFFLLKNDILVLDQVQLRTEVSTPSRSWQYISCHWDACSNHLAKWPWLLQYISKNFKICEIKSHQNVYWKNAITLV